MVVTPATDIEALELAELVMSLEPDCGFPKAAASGARDEGRAHAASEDEDDEEEGAEGVGQMGRTSMSGSYMCGASSSSRSVLVSDSDSDDGGFCSIVVASASAESLK